MTDKKTQTVLTHISSDPKSYQGVVSMPVHRASTIVFDNLEAFENRAKSPFPYGRAGTPTSAAFEAAISTLEGAAGSVSTCSGLSAIVVAVTALAKAGDHVLVPDNVYGPTRKFCADFLASYGVTVTFYDPMADVESLFTPATKIMFIEAPGSLTYEVPDIDRLISAARTRGIATVMDNSWATPLLFRPLERGVDVSLMSATKYVTGHSDAMLGVVSGTEKTYPLLKKTALMLGLCAGSEELYLGLRGLRTLHVRMKEHERRGLEIARWLAEQKGVRRVLHPALPSCAGHENWKKYFSGACGTFGIVLEAKDRQKFAAMVDSLRLFGIGASWGGYESLCFPEQPASLRTASSWQDEGFSLRLHVGFEDVEDLKNDLATGLARMLT